MNELEAKGYLAGARNLYRHLWVQPGENVLLLPTFEFIESDPLALEAVMQAGRELGAEVAVAIIEGCGTRGNPPRPIARAMESSDVFLAMGDKTPNPISGHCLSALKARWDYGAKQADLHGGKGILATECSSFPTEVLLAIGRVMHEKLNRGKKITIVDDQGTDLSFPYDPQDIYGFATHETGHLEAGQRATWPLGNITILPGDSFCGTAMVNCLRGVAKFFDRPARIKIENCWAVEIEDREETKKIKAEFAKPENANFVDKIIIGLNPKGSISRGILRSRFGELCQSSGVTQLGIGDRPGYVASHFYSCAFLLEPTITLDGEVLFDHGRPCAFDDAGVRAVAGKFGDPDKLLAKIP